MTPIELLHLRAGWLGIALGVLSGAAIGLLFHREDWLGGYQSWSRRLIRLGHISFFGLAFLNFMYALTLHCVGARAVASAWASPLFIVGAVSMPLVCFLSAWKKPARHLFPIPVLSIAGGIAGVFFALA